MPSVNFAEGGVDIVTAKEVAPLVVDKRIKYREDIVDGLDAAPSALIGLFEGRNFGKMLVRVSEVSDTYTAHIKVT